jgi:hypothetical protein
VSIESLNEDLAQRERDVRALSEDSAQLVDDSVENAANAARVIQEDVVAAEFVATESAIENVNGLLSALTEIGSIQNAQLKAFFADHRDTFTALLKSRSPGDLLQLGFEHWNRRATHIAEGLTQTIGVLASETRHMATSAGEMWKPVVELVRGDWTRR